MRKITPILFFVLMLLPVQILSAQANDVPAGLVKSFKDANANGVASYLNENVEMVVPGAENLYAKAQATSILADFFRKNAVKNFVVVHHGTKESAAFLIGNYISTNGSFRVSVFTRKAGAQFLVYQLRIEKTE